MLQLHKIHNTIALTFHGWNLAAYLQKSCPYDLEGGMEGGREGEGEGEGEGERERERGREGEGERMGQCLLFH